MQLHFVNTDRAEKTAPGLPQASWAESDYLEFGVLGQSQTLPVEADSATYLAHLRHLTESIR